MKYKDLGNEWTRGYWKWVQNNIEKEGGGVGQQ